MSGIRWHVEGNALLWEAESGAKCPQCGREVVILLDAWHNQVLTDPVLFGTYDWWIVIFDAAMTTAKLQSLLYMVYTILGISLICMNQLMFAIDLARESLIIVAICDLLFLVVLVPCVQTYGIYGYLLLQIAQLFAVAGCKYFFISRRVHKLERQKA